MIKRNELKNFTIKTEKDVKAFVDYIIKELRCNYHPDDSFADIVDIKTNQQTFDNEAIEYLDNLNADCFEVAGEKYYDIALQVMDEVIPPMDMQEDLDKEKYNYTDALLTDCLDEQFIEGDIVKIKPEWLSEEEKKDPKYAEQEYYVRSCYDGKVELICSSNLFTGYSVHHWPADTVYKVGHVDSNKLKQE